MARTEVRGDNVEEESLVVSKIPFSEPNWASTNVKAAIIESATGKDAHPTDHVLVGETLTIDNNRQHVVVSEILNEGDIINNGGTLGVI